MSPEAEQPLKVSPISRSMDQFVIMRGELDQLRKRSCYCDALSPGLCDICDLVDQILKGEPCE